MNRLWWRCKRICRYYYLRVLRINLPTAQVARGVAIGVFVGFLPIIPFQLLLAVTLAYFLKASKVAAMLCTFFVNPLNMIPVYALLYQFGKLFMPASSAVFDAANLPLTEMLKLGLEQGWDFLQIMLLGGFILGLPLALIAYFASYALLTKYRSKRQQ